MHGKSGVRVVAIVPAAGAVRRMKLKTRKPFVLLAGKPLISYTLNALNSCDIIDEIVVAAEKPLVRRFKGLIRQFRFKKVVDVVAGGRTRSESVRNCLNRIVLRSSDIVVVHDGGRPFVESKLIKRIVGFAKKYGGAIAAIPQTDTVKLADEALFVTGTLDRTRIYRAQTPQAFRYGLLKKAYGSIKKKVTDDSGLVEGFGGKVKIIEGSPKNIKITTKEDLKLAEALL